MTHKHQKHPNRYFRNTFFVLGIVSLFSGLTTTGTASLSEQGTTVIDTLGTATLEQGFAVHSAAQSDTESAAAMLTLGAILFLLSFGFHAFTHLPNERKVKVRRAPSYTKKALHKKTRAREVIWIEKVIRL